MLMGDAWSGEDSLREEPDAVDVRGHPQEHLQPGRRQLQRRGAGQEDQRLRLRSLSQPKRRHDRPQRSQQYVRADFNTLCAWRHSMPRPCPPPLAPKRLARRRAEAR